MLEKEQQEVSPHERVNYSLAWNGEKPCEDGTAGNTVKSRSIRKYELRRYENEMGRAAGLGLPLKGTRQNRREVGNGEGEKRECTRKNMGKGVIKGEKIQREQLKIIKMRKQKQVSRFISKKMGGNADCGSGKRK